MFGTKLEETVKGVAGGKAAIVMGFDGIPVDQFTADVDQDIETLGMEFSVLLKEVRKAAELLDAGVAQELTVRTEKLSTILRVINDEYFVALAIAPDGNLGKGRYLLRVIAPEFALELV
jgi:predicted regulator of Ras-like GTPase activity (Roadblock/LC7/MglB family)